MKNYVLVRFMGGSGGERIASIAAYYLDQEYQSIVTSHNRFMFNDLFNTALQLEAPSDDLVNKLNIPNTYWYNMDAEMISTVVESFKQQHPFRSVGKTHYHFDKNLDYSVAFKGFKILDLKPSHNKLWLITALQLYKTACNIETTDLVHSGTNVSRFQHIITDHFNTHGWWPEYWMWYGPIPWNEFIDKVCLDIVSELEHNTVISTPGMLLESANIVTDIKLSWTEEFCKFIGISELIPEHRAEMLEWVNGNLKILEQLGLADKINENLSATEQVQLLKSTFLPIYDDIIYEKFNIRI